MNDRRLITAEDLLRMRFPSEPRLAPDGSAVVFVLMEIDREKNHYVSHLWLVPLLPEPDPSTPRQLTFALCDETQSLDLDATRYVDRELEGSDDVLEQRTHLPGGS